MIQQKSHKPAQLNQRLVGNRKIGRMPYYYPAPGSKGSDSFKGVLMVEGAGFVANIEVKEANPTGSSISRFL